MVQRRIHVFHHAHGKHQRVKFLPQVVGLLGHGGRPQQGQGRRACAKLHPSRAKPGGFVAMQLEPSMTARAGCTVVIDAQLRLECATLPGVDWLAALSAALAERGR